MLSSKSSSDDPGRNPFSEDEEQETPVPHVERIASHKKKLRDLRLGLIRINYDEITIPNLVGYQKDINDILEHVDDAQEDEDVKACFQDIQKFLGVLDETKELLASIKAFKGELAKSSKSLKTIRAYHAMFNELKKLYNEAIKQFVIDNDKV